jgi:predicted phosphoribosyltransferase/dienelactone hydrolase
MVRTVPTGLSIPVAGVRLDADVMIPRRPDGLVVFAHGSGSSRHSPRNRAVAEALRERGYGTILADLLTVDEERDEAARFDIDLLARRLGGLVDWLVQYPETADLPIGLFGASTGAAAAMVAAASRPAAVRAIVSRGGRPDLAGAALSGVRVPVLLLVGEVDRQVLKLNRRAGQALGGTRELRVVRGASHLFEEPGTLAAVAEHAAGWFDRYLNGAKTFRDRSEAGAMLAAEVAANLELVNPPGRPLVLALPRGGVPVGYEVARRIGADLDVTVARKIGLPWEPEYGVGAVTPDGAEIFDEHALRYLRLTTEELRPHVEKERAEARRRLERYRDGRPPPDVGGRPVIVVDDGLATGVTARAALAEIRRSQPAYLVFAAPVCAPDSAHALADDCDAVICLAAPGNFRAVGQWYEDFHQLTDEEVQQALRA